MEAHAGLELKGQHLLLLPDRAVFWREARMLIVADLHLGKAQFFRERGVPVPVGTTAADLDRLSALLDRYHPDRLLFLGDLVHGRTAQTGDLTRRIERWRRRHSAIECLLVSGNHDRRAGAPPHPFRFDRVSFDLVRPPFLFTHQPKTGLNQYSIAGHIHPAVTLRGKGRFKETLPCFCFGRRAALLPAFGGFTGTQVIRPSAEDRVFVAAGDAVVKVQ